jgi:acyl-CoA synthetase (AMP-forming)/AMP-acid ligase II
LDCLGQTINGNKQRQLHKNLHLFASVQKSSGSQVAFTNTDYNWVKRIAGIKDVFKTKTTNDWPEVRWIETNKSVPTVKEEGLLKDPINPLDLAFLQYTSGSTSDPKGVMISHSNLSHNMTRILESLDASTSTLVVSWLPQYHDMGLIGSYLTLIYGGGSGVYMSPVSFIRNPPMWIASVAKYRGTHLQAPNFAYILTSRKFKGYLEKNPSLTPETFDLSCVRHMFNAAEPVTAESCDAFKNTFAPYGFKGEAIIPGYGLAEHCVYVCDYGCNASIPPSRLIVNKDALEKDGKVVLVDASAASTEGEGEGEGKVRTSQQIGCGRPARNPDICILIVDHKTCKPLEDDTVGEIWVHSPSKAGGYYGLTEKSEEDFHAKLAEEVEGEAKLSSPRNAITELSKTDGFLRTGDLGFIHDGELYICGRMKDLIIIRGRNHYPQDIEHCADQDDRLRPGCSAAFSVSVNNNESLVLVAEVRDESTASVYEEISASVRSRVSNEHGVSIYALVLVKPRSIYKTSSGKIARQRTMMGFKNKGELQAVYQWTVAEGAAEEELKEDAPIEVGSWDSPEDLLKKLCDDAAKFLGPEGKAAGVNPKTPLIDLGLDSMSLNQFKGLLTSKYSVKMSDEEMYSEETCIETIRDYILKNGVDPSSIKVVSVTSPDPVASKPAPMEVAPKPAAVAPPQQPKCCSIM